GDRHAAVVGAAEAARVVGRDPEIVVVAVGGLRRTGEGLPAVGGAPELHVVHPDGVLVLRVGEDAGVVPRPLAKLPLAVHPRPAVAAVVGAEDPTRIGLHDGEDPLGVGGRDGNPDVADGAGGEAGGPGDLFPGPPRVGA